MQISTQIEDSLYEEMRKHPFFFLRLHEENKHGYNSSEETYLYWEAIDHEDVICFSAGNFGNISIRYCLCKVDKGEFVLDKEGHLNENMVTMYFHEVVPSENDLYAILYDCVSRSMNLDDKYSFVTLLWVLDECSISQQTLVDVLRKIPNAQSRVYVLEILRQHGRCLSRNKQMVLANVCEEFGARYDIYMPAMLVEALDFCQGKGIDRKHANLFSLVDFVMSSRTDIDLSAAVGTDNPLIKLRLWFKSDSSFGDYSILPSLFTLVSEPVKLLMVKRYFHDVRLGNTEFDCELIKQFIDNKYDSFTRYRYSITTPMDSIILTVPLLCDTLLTLYNTKGKEFQTFNGILDFAITHCDSSHPSVDWKLERILPICNHGVVINNDFKGFVDYQYVCEINESKLQDKEGVETVIRYLLDHHFSRVYYPSCIHENGSMLLNGQCELCPKINEPNNRNSSGQLNCVVYKPYADRWKVDVSEPSMSTFVSKVIDSESEARQNAVGSVLTLDMVSVKSFHQYVLNLASKYTNLGNGEFLVPSYKDKSFELGVLERFWNIRRVRIMPRLGIKVNENFDVFGVWKDVSKTLSKAELQNEHSSGYIAAEEKYRQLVSDEISKRCVESLKSILGTNEYNGEYFEIPYQEDVLENVLNKYYFKDSSTDNNQKFADEFLMEKPVNSKFLSFCAPKQSEDKFFAINLPYFWCRGKECFHNNLGNQTLEEENKWWKYSLYHLVEIIGYPKLHKKDAGYEPDDAVRTFIAIVNKVMQKFKRLKCRGCGHLMFANKSRGFNRYNYFSCVNPLCPEHGKSIYLNYCFKCKRGLIDSRDTKRCPNNWYICPDCLACCDDSMYARQVQLYILANKPVPDKLNAMLGQGHNDKNIFFCPDCGCQILITKDEHDNEIKICPHCKRDFNDKL